MDYVSRPQIAAPGNGGLTQRDRANLIAFSLNPWPAFSADGAGHSCSQHEIGIGGIDDGFAAGLGYISLTYHDARAPVSAHGRPPLASPPILCQAGARCGS